MNELKVFISHHHEEKLLAQAWQNLIKTMTMGACIPWYSSDERVEGGGSPGEWHKQIKKKIKKADIILVLVTPVSNEKPWLFFESGLASGQKKEIIPVYYFMKQTAINSVFSSIQSYQGDRVDGEKGIKDLCGKLMHSHLGNKPPDEAMTPWASWIEQYMEEVNEERENSFARTLFHDHFHNFDAAESLEGDWFAKWTQIYDDDRPEDVFEVDSLLIWTTDTRIRLVGASTKSGINNLSIKASDEAKHYPMEGVVSRSGWVALSYWSAGTIPICGTALLIPIGASGELLEGTWQGFTSRDINDTPTFTRGKVVMSKSLNVVEDYWPELTPQN